MPVLISADEKPTFIAKPDMRFATTFLSVNYRDYAVNGESVMDKATGEIYTRRPHDGRFVSFFQNKKYMYDLCLELRVLLNNNPSFTYDRDSTTGFYTAVDYDAMSIMNEQRTNIITDDFVIPNEEEDTTTNMKFHLSSESNGFFVRATTRDCDKALVEFITNTYDNMFKDVVPEDDDMSDEAVEARKFLTIEKWADSNATIEYTAKISTETKEKVYTMTDYIHINEECCVYLPYSQIEADFPRGYDSCLITIKSFTYDKIHYIMNRYDTMSDEFKEVYNQLVYPDFKVHIDYYSFYYFIDKSTDIQLLGNEFVIALLDIPYVNRYMAKMAALVNASLFMISIKRPNDYDWVIGGVWAERVRDVYKNGITVSHLSETDIRKMEAMFSGVSYDDTIVQTDPTDAENFYLRDNSITVYSAPQIDGLVKNLKNRLGDQADNIVVRASNNGNLSLAKHMVTKQGMILGTVSTDVVNIDGTDEIGDDSVDAEEDDDNL